MPKRPILGDTKHSIHKHYFEMVRVKLGKLIIMSPHAGIFLCTGRYQLMFSCLVSAFPKMAIQSREQVLSANWVNPLLSFIEVAWQQDEFIPRNMFSAFLLSISFVAVIDKFPRIMWQAKTVASIKTAKWLNQH